MPSAAVEEAFRERLAANWTYTPIIGANGVTQPPSDGSGFALIHYPVTDGSRPYLTKRRFEEGAARIILNVPSGDEVPDWLEKADEIAALFRGDHLVFDGVEVFEPSSPILNDDNEDGNYYELAVIVPYRYQFDVS